MKHLTQIVAFLAMVLLAVPSALAESICIAERSQPVSMECCAVDHISVASANADLVQDCSEGCCSVAPQNSPPPIVPDKFKSDLTGPDALVVTASLLTYSRFQVTARAVDSSGRTEDLPVLLHTFRI